MKGRSSAIERLEIENACLRRQLEERRKPPGDLPVDGCGDNSCMVQAPRGMGTNGGCRCEAPALRRALRYYQRLAAFREETIRELRSGTQAVRS